MQVYFAHSQPCRLNHNEPHHVHAVAKLKYELQVEVVVKMTHPKVTPKHVAEFLAQFCHTDTDTDTDTTDDEYPKWSKTTLVVVDLSVVQDPIGVQTVIHNSLTMVPNVMFFLILQPLLPTGCAFCPCSDWCIANA